MDLTMVILSGINFKKGFATQGNPTPITDINIKGAIDVSWIRYEVNITEYVVVSVLSEFG